MAYNLVVLDDVLFELEDTVSWYAKISVELSGDVVVKFTHALSLIQLNPLRNPELRDGFRKVNLVRFPYKLIYKVFPDEILVAALAHHKRHPNYWRKR